MIRSALLVVLLLAAPAGAKETADHLFLGDHIVTMDPARPTATALAVRGESIAWIGERAEAEAWKGESTTVHELGGHALLPGFIDAHGHLTLQAILVDAANVASPPVGPATTIAELQKVLRDEIAAKQIPAGGVVFGAGYDDSLLAERRHPTRTDLDAVSTDHTIVLLHVSGHLMTANSKALADAEIHADTPDPEGGTIRREADGETPNGVLEETATYPLRGVLSRPLEDDQILRAVDVFARHGVTTIQDGATGEEAVAHFARLDEAGSLRADVVAYPVGMDPKTIPADARFGARTRRVNVPGIKLVLDGSPQGKTAFLREPYHVPPAGQTEDYRGYPIVPGPAVDGLVALWSSRKVPILAHANGDAAADLLIEAVAKAKADWDHRTVMIHAQTVREDQLDRMKELGIIPSFFSAHTFYWGDWHRDSVLGPERASRISPTRSARNRGMHFTVHNDAPVVPPDMIRLLWATTNRLTRSDRVLGKDQVLTVQEALEAVTTEAAYQHFEEDRKGSLVVGKQADLVVLSENPLAVPPAELLRVRVAETWSRGARIHAAAGATP